MNRSTIGRDIIIVVLAACLGINIYGHYRKHTGPDTASTFAPFKPTNVTPTSGPVRDVPTAAPADRAAVKAATSKQTVQASVTTAVNHSTGEGTVTFTTPESAPESPTTPAAEAQQLRVHFKDYRLEFNTEGSTARYTLDQQFSIIQTLERAKDGTRSAKAEVFEITPTGRVPLQQVTTSVVERDDTLPHWLTGFNVQGGIRPGPKSAVVGLQWLKHGRANNPGDLKYAILTPVVTFGGGGADVGLLPISFNVANYIPHQPTTNVWVSPYVGYFERKLGIVVSVTF